jgi:hypothetical protein
MTIGQLLAGQKGLLYKVASTNEKALREDKRMKIEELKKQRQLRESQRLPKAWSSDKVIS